MEIPYIHDYNKAIPKGYFDIEEEKLPQTLDAFINHLKMLMNGKPHKDKYGNILRPIKGINDKKQFVAAFKKATFFETFDNLFGNPNWEKLLLGK